MYYDATYDKDWSRKCAHKTFLQVMAEMPLGSSLHAFLIDVALTHYAGCIQQGTYAAVCYSTMCQIIYIHRTAAAGLGTTQGGWICKMCRHRCQTTPIQMPLHRLAGNLCIPTHAYLQPSWHRPIVPVGHVPAGVVQIGVARPGG